LILLEIFIFIRNFAKLDNNEILDEIDNDINDLWTWLPSPNKITLKLKYLKIKEPFRNINVEKLILYRCTVDLYQENIHTYDFININATYYENLYDYCLTMIPYLVPELSTLINYILGHITYIDRKVGIGRTKHMCVPSHNLNVKDVECNYYGEYYIEEKYLVNHSNDSDSD